MGPTFLRAQYYATSTRTLKKITKFEEIKNKTKDKVDKSNLLAKWRAFYAGESIRESTQDPGYGKTAVIGSNRVGLLHTPRKNACFEGAIATNSNQP